MSRDEYRMTGSTTKSRAALARDAAIARVVRTRRWMIVAAAALTAGFAALVSALAPGRSLAAKQPSASASTSGTSSTASSGASGASTIASNSSSALPTLPPAAGPGSLGLQGPAQAPQSAPSQPQQSAPSSPAPATPAPSAPAPAPPVVSGGS